jgi:ABC transporter with metal-binding/Fe-S-binding domain ATP-binding protein
MGLKVERLVTFCPQDPESKLFHIPNVKWTVLQAESMGILQTLVEVPMNQEYDVLCKTLITLRERHGIEGAVAGVIASSYQKRVLQEVCNKAGLKLIVPLWGRDPFDVVNQMVNEGVKAIIVGVYAEGLTQQWLGKEVGQEFLEHLKKLSRTWGVSPCGEGGEYETFVVDAPFFAKRIKMVNYEVVWRRNWGELIILDAVLIEKG